MSASRDAERLRQFLLGEVSDSEREAIERQCLAEHSLIFEQLVAIEDELRFDYLQNRLSPADHARFEKRFLADSEGRERLAFAQAMLMASDSAPAATAQTAGNPWPHRIAIGVLGLAVAGLAVLAWVQFNDARHLERDLEKAMAGETESSAALVAAQADTAKAQADLTAMRNDVAAARDELSREQARRQEMESHLTTVAHPTPTPAAQTDDGISALTLKPGLISSGRELSKVDLPSVSKGLNLALTLPGGAAAYPMYAAALLSADGKPIWTATHLSRNGKAVPFVIPAGRLKRADYQVLLRGVLNNGHPEDVAGYAFRVAAR